MQKRQVGLKLGVGIIKPMVPDLLLKRCQYITANFTVTGPASVPDEPLGDGMGCLQSKEAGAIPPSPTASPASRTTHEEVPRRFNPIPGPHAVPCRPQVLDWTSERAIPLLTFSPLRMLLQNASLQSP